MFGCVYFIDVSLLSVLLFYSKLSKILHPLVKNPNESKELQHRVCTCYYNENYEECARFEALMR